MVFLLNLPRSETTLRKHWSRIIWPIQEALVWITGLNPPGSYVASMIRASVHPQAGHHRTRLSHLILSVPVTTRLLGVSQFRALAIAVSSVLGLYGKHICPDSHHSWLNTIPMISPVSLPRVQSNGSRRSALLLDGWVNPHPVDISHSSRHAWLQQDGKKAVQAFHPLLPWRPALQEPGHVISSVSPLPAKFSPSLPIG